LAPKAGLKDATRVDEITVLTNANGALALIEFTGALPRAQLFTNWLVQTNDTEVLSLLTNAAFQPHQTVVVSTPFTLATNSAPTTNAGDVKFLSYAPKQIRLAATATAPSVLLLNDKYSANWHVTVDGRPADLLRCNYLMRGVVVPVGAHEIEFHYRPPITGLYVTFAGIATALALLGLVLFTRQLDSAPPAVRPAPVS
jgi:hypothetical protein